MKDETAKIIPADLMEVIGCPRCNGPLSEKGACGPVFLECPACGLAFPVKGGLADLTPESARPIAP